MRRREGRREEREEVGKEEEEERDEEELERRRVEEVSRESHRLLELSQVLGLPTVCWARARVSVLPSPYDTYSLALAPGQLVRVVSRSEGGLWWGEAGGRAGRLKFVNLTVLEEEPGGGEGGQEAGGRAGEQEQAGVTSLLASLGLQALATRLSLNGFDSLARLEGLTRWVGRVIARDSRHPSVSTPREDLDFLEIHDNHDQQTLLAATSRMAAGDKSGPVPGQSNIRHENFGSPPPPSLSCYPPAF